MNWAAFSQRVSRVDFLDGVGIHVSANQIALAHVTKRFFQVRLAHAAVAPLPGVDHPAERRQVLAETILGFARREGIDTGRAVLVLPRDLAAVSRVLLPLAARENLAQVLEFESENLLPLPRDKVLVDYGVREIGGERLEVLLVACPADVVREHLQALEDAFVRPRAVVLTSMALADYVAFCRGDGEQPIGLVVEEARGTELAVVRDGRLLASQLLPRRGAGDDAALARASSRIASESGVTLEDEGFYEWPGVGGDDRLLKLASGPLELSPDLTMKPDAALLPAIGAALGAVREGRVTLNLLPAEGRRRSEEGLSVATVVLTAVVMVLAVVWGTSALVKDAMLRRQVTEQLEALEPQVREARALEDEIESMQGQMNVLTAGQDQRVTLLIKELTDIVPGDAYLTSLNVRGGRITMDGQARAASDLIAALEKSRHFRNVSFTSPTTRVGDKERFSIVAEVAQ